MTHTVFLILLSLSLTLSSFFILYTYILEWHDGPTLYFQVCIYCLVVTLFFGKLSQGEQERLMEKAKDAIMETCLAMTIFRQEFNTSFLLLFTLLLFLKVFHWIAMDRVEYAGMIMRQSFIC